MPLFKVYPKSVATHLTFTIGDMQPKRILGYYGLIVALQHAIIDFSDRLIDKLKNEGLI